MTDVTEHDDREPAAGAHINAPADSQLVQITLNGVTLTVKKIVSVKELLRKAYGSNAISRPFEDHYIVAVKEHDKPDKSDEYHLGMTIELSESERYLAVPTRLASLA